MKLAIIIVLCIASTATAEVPGYQPGTLVDLSRDSTGGGALRAQGSFCMAVDSGELTYVLRRTAYWRWSYEPTDLVVGDTFPVKVSGNSMTIKRTDGKELKLAISRRERRQNGKPSASCALPVSLR